jgi:hypothetical protein
MWFFTRRVNVQVEAFLRQFNLDVSTIGKGSCQGCQIFLGTRYQNCQKCTKLPQNYQIAVNIPNGCKIYQMAINFTNNFHSKALQNIPKFEVLMKINHLATLARTNRFTVKKKKNIFGFRTHLERKRKLSKDLHRNQSESHLVSFFRRWLQIGVGIENKFLC